MTLPPFVIINGNLSVLKVPEGQKPVLWFLGATGWQRERMRALSFQSGDEAERWIVDATKSTPALFATAKARVIRLQQPKPEETGGVRLQKDYDPFAFDVVGAD